MLKNKKMKRVYVQQNSINEEKEMEFKNKMADDSCHPDTGAMVSVDSQHFSQEQILKELREHECGAMHDFKKMEEGSIDDSIKDPSNERTHMLSECELDSANVKAETPDPTQSQRTLENVESGYSLNSSSCGSSSTIIREKRRKTCYINCSKAVGFLLAMVLSGTVGYIIHSTLTKLDKDTESVALAAVGIPSTDIPIFGLFTVDQEILSRSPHDVRWVPRTDQIPHYGIETVANDSCVKVQYSGLYKIENQITFKFKADGVDLASHRIEIDRGDGNPVYLIRRQIPAPLFKPEIVTVRQPSNIGVLASVQAGELICVRTYPNEAIYVSSVDNVLDVDLRILFPEGEEFEFHDPQALEDLDLDSTENDPLTDEALEELGLGKALRRKNNLPKSISDQTIHDKHSDRNE